MNLVDALAICLCCLVTSLKVAHSRKLNQSTCNGDMKKERRERRRGVKEVENEELSGAISVT